MRVLSKYWTRRTPPGAPLSGSVMVTPGAGPQYQERFAVRSATWRSVRSQTRWNAGSAKAGSAAAAGAGARAGPNTETRVIAIRVGRQGCRMVAPLGGGGKFQVYRVRPH